MTCDSVHEFEWKLEVSLSLAGSVAVSVSMAGSVTVFASVDGNCVSVYEYGWKRSKGGCFKERLCV
jgi:hypothetical protein